MKGVSQLIDFVHHLRCAYEYMHGFRRDRPGTNAERLGQKFATKIEWLYRDLLTNPHFPEEIRIGLREEWESDSFATDAILEKIALLNNEQRLSIETIIDLVLQGQKLKIETDESITHDAID